MSKEPITWTPPGAGEWQRDDSHHPSAYTRYLAELFVPAMLEGFRAGFAAVGAPIAGFDVAWIAGRPYQRAQIVGAPSLPIWGDSPPAKLPAASKPPPPFVLKLLFLVHPELRRRKARAVALWRDRPWRELHRQWNEELEPAAIAECSRLQRVDPARLDARALAAHLEAINDSVRAAGRQHFEHTAFHSVVTGDFLVQVAGWTGATPSEIVQLLRGASPASRAGADHLARVAEAVRGARGAHDLVMSPRSATEIVTGLRDDAGPAGEAFRGYLDVYGDRLVTGVDVYERALVEMPELIVRSLRATLKGEARPKQDADSALSTLREKTPAEHQPMLAELYEEARLLYSVRDADTSLMTWRMGLLRRALRAAGRQLVEVGKLWEPDHLFDASPDEAISLLRGEAGPDRDELAARATRRAEDDRLVPPVRLGPPGEMPAERSFPPAIARLMRASTAFMSAFDGVAPAAKSADLAGTAASPGVYTGRARVVHGPDDFARLEAGDVLIAPLTTPAFNVVLPLLGAVVTERGGVLSHAALVAREYGIPAVVATGDATTKIPDGAEVRVDGTAGVVAIVAQQSQTRPRAAVAPAATPAPVAVPERPSTAGNVVALADARALEFGGKARALAAALAAKLPVPNGFALDADLVAHVAAGDASSLERALKACAELPTPWAVRSSAVDEDSADASFAGQHATVLGVVPATLADAIARVHASGHAASALAYRARMGIVASPRMGVVIQSLLRPEVAGVMFSRDPTTDREGRLIEATWGLGEALVSGIVTPDRFRIADGGAVLESVIADKHIAIEAGDTGGTAERDVAADRARRACLDTRWLGELDALARRCEAVFAGPQDLEWAIAADALYLLQSRPVTAGAIRGTSTPDHAASQGWR